MSRHYFGNQYERPYGSTVLNNWEVPKSYRNGYLVDRLRPNRRTLTQIISNDQGHLIPGVPRPKARPWIRFPTTWYLPNKIDRKTANEISGLNRIKKNICPEETKGAEEAKKAESVGGNEEKTVAEEVKRTENEPKAIKGADEHEFIRKTEDENDLNLANSCIPYVPGDLTEEIYRPNSYEELSKSRYFDENSKNSIGVGYPKTLNDFSEKSPVPEPNSTAKTAEFLKNHREMLKTTFKPKKEPSNSLQEVIHNFQLAKELHKQNLDHIPLPDKVCHDEYQKYQMLRGNEIEPGLGLDEPEFGASGIGWKGYQGFGPTKCTKMKVFRPKSFHPRRPGEKLNTWANFEQKWRFIKHTKVTPIDLALCWDLTPENPDDEPKPPTHIDGSNGSLAPAVFTLVHTPKNEENAKNIEKCDGIHECTPLFYSTHKLNEKLDFFERKSARDFSKQLQDKLDQSKRANSAYELRELKKINEKETRNKKIAPLPAMFSKEKKNCVSCQMKNITIRDKPESRNEYKFAFKAGCMQQNKRRKDKRQDYPEHWRLATVYQHSYKPIQNRKGTLLSTVFK